MQPTRTSLGRNTGLASTQAVDQQDQIQNDVLVDMAQQRLQYSIDNLMRMRPSKASRVELPIPRLPVFWDSSDIWQVCASALDGVSDSDDWSNFACKLDQEFSKVSKEQEKISGESGAQDVIDQFQAQTAESLSILLTSLSNENLKTCLEKLSYLYVSSVKCCAADESLKNVLVDRSTLRRAMSCILSSPRDCNQDSANGMLGRRSNLQLVSPILFKHSNSDEAAQQFQPNQVSPMNRAQFVLQLESSLSSSDSTDEFHISLNQYRQDFIDCGSGGRFTKDQRASQWIYMVETLVSKIDSQLVAAS
ncbi:hypothetical protein SCG7086_AF_00230 [Chlamydiales bacterium SCGC AG-110-P3]|nr:hypothetical protein SCG7086_AF_00230 [Chlamydiales bacterium SCGC AG-110-P3]